MALSPRDRRALIILGVLAVAALGFFLLTRGGGEPAELAAPTTPAVPTSQPTPEPAETPEPRRFNFFSGRDPFLPLVTAPAEGTEDGTGTETGGGGVEEPTDGAEQAAQGQDGATTTVGGRTVTLIDIVDSNTAQVSVDGQSYTVDEGEEFGDNFRLVSVSGSCARFLHGDESFTLCEGGERK